MIQAPLAIVWRCAMSVSAYSAAGKQIEIPDAACPSCMTILAPWGWYQRTVRHGGNDHPLLVRRGRCGRCRKTHALLPDFVHARRLYAVEEIGAALDLAATGKGAWSVSVALDRPFATVRDWLSRCRRRGAELLPRVVMVGLQLGAVFGELPTKPVAAVVAALEITWRRSQERSPRTTPTRWRFWNSMCSGSALARNTSPV